MTYDPLDWYWLADDGRVFGSARQAIVDKTDKGFIAREEAGTVTRWPPDGTGVQTVASLQAEFDRIGVPVFVDLKRYAAAARYAKETAGITVGTAPVATDRDSQGMITGMWAAAQINPNISVSFKSGSGFVTIGTTQVDRIAAAVAGYVQACFTAEAQVVAAIAAGTVTTPAAIDAAFAAVVTTFAGTAAAGASS